MQIISKQLAGILIAVGLALILTLNIFLIQPISLGLILAAGLILAVIFLYSPFWGLLAFIAIRPSIDQFSEDLSINLGDRITLSGASFIGILLIILSALLILKTKKSFFRHPIVILWGLYLASILVSLIFSIQKSATFYEFIRVMSISVIFIDALILVNNYKKLIWSILAVLVSALIPFLVALYQAASGSGLGGTAGIESRIFGTFAHPNAFASFVIIIIAVAGFLLFQEKKSQKKELKTFLLYFALAISFIILLATFSRGAILALLLFVFSLSLFRSPKYILFTVAIFLAVFAVSDTFRDRVEDVYNPPADSSIRWRFQQWDKMFELYTQKPLWGYGAGTETIVHEKEFGFYAGNPYTHNDLLRSALETGIPGLITFTLLWLATILLLFKNHLRGKAKQKEIFLLIIFSLALAELAFSMSSNIFRGTATQWTLWFLIGIAFALEKIKAGKKSPA